MEPAFCPGLPPGTAGYEITVSEVPDAVPEPATLTLIAGGVGLLALYRRHGMRPVQESVVPARETRSSSSTALARRPRITTACSPQEAHRLPGEGRANLRPRRHSPACTHALPSR
jgi:hypothetical protein